MEEREDTMPEESLLDFGIHKTIIQYSISPLNVLVV